MKNERKFSAFLLTDRATRRYFSGVDLAEGILLVGENNIYFADRRYYLLLCDKLKGTDVKTVPFESLADVKRVLEENKTEKLLVDYSVTTVEEYEKYKGLGLPIENAKPILDEMRAVKSEDELAKIKKACEIIEQAFYKTLPKIREGVTETEIRAALESECSLLGAEGQSFETIVAFGENTAVPHHETGETKLRKNEPVLIDAGVFYKGYASDFTRTVFYGTPSDEFKRVYNAVLSANELAEEKIVAGMTAKDADGIAREELKIKGYGDKFTHSLGHGVGLEIHEFPYISKKCDYVLRDGNVFTVEPGAYLDYKFGVRIEDTVFIGGGKVKRFFTDEKKLVILK